MDHGLWVGQGTIARVGVWAGDAAPALFTNTTTSNVRPPACQFHGTFMSCTDPPDNLSILETTEHPVVFFVEGIHQLELVMHGVVDADTPIQFAISGVAPRVRPSFLSHLINRAPPWRKPKEGKTGN